MINSAIFDLGGVYFTDGTKEAVKKISQRYDLNPEELSNLFGTKSEIGKLYRQGKIKSKQFWNEFEKRFKLKVNEKELTKQWISFYKPIIGTINLIKKLRKKRIKIYFLSDNVKERSEHLQNKFNFLENFNGGLFSHKIGITKSDGIETFKMALKQTGDKAKNVVFIDDKEDYVKTAKKLGMQGIIFKSPQQLNNELIRMLKK
ncbi:HAD hydrolase-like protein [Candidatus Woesearchaeota archaeon]|nr:HAD hydrolase-like protein [Candidatus Woesearchaeota archaeon]